MTSFLSTYAPSRREFLTANELKKYSVFRALMAAGDRSGENCLEREISQSYSRATNQVAIGILIPPEVIFGTALKHGRVLSMRTMTATGAPSDGGYTIGEERLPLIDFLFPQSIIFRLGASFTGGFSSTVAIPRVSDSDEAEWLAEGASPSAGAHDTNFGQIVTQPKRALAMRTISKQFAIQAGAGEEMAMRLLMGALGAGIDRGALVGTGGAQPIGIMNDANSTTVSSGTDGGAPTLAILNSVEDAAIAAKVPMTAPGWVVSTNARKKLKNTQKATGTSTFLLETGADDRDRVNGFRGEPTAFLSDTLTKGSGTALGSAIFGADWTTLAVLLYGALDVVSDHYTLADRGQIEICLNAFLDVAKQRPEGFAKLKDIVTS